MGINPDVFAGKGKKFRKGGKGMEGMLSSNGYANLGRDFGNSLNIGKVPPISSADITAAVTGGGGSGAKGALSALAGAIFEAAINSRFGPKGMKGSGRQGFLDSREAGVLGDLDGATIGGDFDVEAGDLDVLRELFGPQATQRGDYKICATPGNRNSFVKKVLQKVCSKSSAISNSVFKSKEILESTMPNVKLSIGSFKSPSCPISKALSSTS